MGHQRRGRQSAGAHKKKGGLLIGMRSGMKKAAGVQHVKSSGPGAGGAGALGKLWTGLTVALIVVTLVLLFRRFSGH